MSDSHLLGRLTGGPFWQLVRPVMGPDEEAVHFAQLRCAQGTEEMSGVLFLTTTQLIWRTIDPRKPEGAAYEVALGDVLGVEQPARTAAFHAFRIVTEDDGLPVDTYFFPQHRTDVDKLLCREMYDAVHGGWTEHRTMRFSA
ncbi:hypothetical protein [Nocardioides jishulii]|uniref:Uncharacterized protein n=1 Tax=Nocardioides jishulii TaxID=2575440 RepID=A0A4U2YRK2_9ACTN|nr:hypothetical protein [Nocardioides jishulii]QCX26183.1 hypothetical protein FCL41_00475 [Nocardioides jishulii]TKI64018.1 hypothetical protein FC770_02235 [Nocardioides jishulii]